MPHSGKSLLGAFSAPVYWLYRLWCRSLRYTEINRAAIENTTDLGRPVVLSLWHDELFPLIYLKRRLNIIALVSQSDDGDLLAGVLERMGLETARGSSSPGRGEGPSCRRPPDARVRDLRLRDRGRPARPAP